MSIWDSFKPKPKPPKDASVEGCGAHVRQGSVHLTFPGFRDIAFPKKFLRPVTKALLRLLGDYPSEEPKPVAGQMQPGQLGQLGGPIGGGLFGGDLGKPDPIQLGQQGEWAGGYSIPIEQQQSQQQMDQLLGEHLQQIQEQTAAQILGMDPSFTQGDAVVKQAWQFTLGEGTAVMQYIGGSANYRPDVFISPEERPDAIARRIWGIIGGAEVWAHGFKASDGVTYSVKGWLQQYTESEQEDGYAERIRHGRPE